MTLAFAQPPCDQAIQNSEINLNNLRSTQLVLNDAISNLQNVNRNFEASNFIMLELKDVRAKMVETSMKIIDSLNATIQLETILLELSQQDVKKLCPQK